MARGGLRRTGWVPKPRSPRKAAEEAAEHRTKAIVKVRSGGSCEICGAKAENVAHRVAKSQGGPWDPANALHLCGQGNLSGCHGWTHQHSGEDDGQAGGWILRSHHDYAAEPAYILHRDETGVARFGWVLLRSDGSVETVTGRPAPTRFPWSRP